MKERFAHYNLELEEVLIGTPGRVGRRQAHRGRSSTQLRSRQIAEEQVETYAPPGEGGGQGARAARGRGPRPSAAAAHRERARRSPSRRNQGKAEYQRARPAGRADPRDGRGGGREGDARRGEASASAHGRGRGRKAARVGIAQAIAIEEQVRAYGGPQFQVTQQVMKRFAEAIEAAGVDVVPKNRGVKGRRVRAARREGLACWRRCWRCSSRTGWAPRSRGRAACAIRPWRPTAIASGRT